LVVLENNMINIGTSDFPEIYKDLGIDIQKLGCVMLDVDCLPNDNGSDEEYGGSYWIQPRDLYYTEDKKKFWINGWVAGKSAHVTLLYGLMKKAKEWEKYINKLLKDWSLKKVEIDHVGFFESPYKDEPYYCIVAHIKVTPELLEGHQRLELLPHINTFTGYKPHMTIAYIKKDEKLRDKVIKELNDFLKGKKLEILKLNLGK